MSTTKQDSARVGCGRLVRRALRWLRSDPMRDAMARKMREARSLRDAADSEWEKDFQRFRLGALKIQSCFCIPPNTPVIHAEKQP